MNDGMTGGSDAAVATGKKRRTNVGQACLNCRRRKARCDGAKPTCKTCFTYNDQCAWGEDDDGRKPASRQYVNSLKNRIKALEAVLRDKGQDLPHEEDEPEDEPEDMAGVTNNMLHLYMGESGETVGFHGPTSAYAHSTHSHVPLSVDDVYLGGRPTDYRRYLPPSVAISFAQHAKILDRFFRYFASWCMRAVPDLFHQDMIRAITLPPSTPPPRFSHYSPFLHNIILATALSWADSDELNTTENRLAFANNAEFHLARELPRPTLATVQGLGIKSSYYSTLGDHTSGWTYFGMADRAAHSLGLNIDCATLVQSAKMSRQEMLLRHNTFWAIFAQEQAWSVYIGRPHTVFDYSTPLPVVDRKLDEMQWTWNNESGPMRGTPAQDCMFSTTFVETAKLAIIMQRVMTTLYSLKSDIVKLQKDNTLSELGLALDAWNEQLPASLTISGHSLKNALPHIIMLQLSREWLTILIHRPYYRPISSSRSEKGENFFSLAVRRCDRAAARINSLLATYHERFGLRFSPPTLINITFTAGTTHLLAAVRHKSQKIKNDAFESANDCVRYLRNVGESWPAAGHKAEILEGLVTEYHLTGEDVLDSSPDAPKAQRHYSGGSLPQGSPQGPTPIPVTQPRVEESVFAGSFETQSWLPAQMAPEQYSSSSPIDTTSIWALLSSGYAQGGFNDNAQNQFLTSLLSQIALPPAGAPLGPDQAGINHTSDAGRNPFGGFSPFAIPDHWTANTVNQSSTAPYAEPSADWSVDPAQSTRYPAQQYPSQTARTPDDMAALYEMLAAQATPSLAESPVADSRMARGQAGGTSDAQPNWTGFFGSSS